jgi:hypothetical protein
VSEHEEETTEQMVADAQADDNPGQTHYLIDGKVVEDAPVAESAELEPDDDGELEELEVEVEAEPSEEEVNAQAMIAKMSKYGERARKYLAKNMGEVLEEAANDYLECPFCNFTDTPGFLHASPCPPELMGTVSEWAYGHTADEYQPDTASRECSGCAGLGVTLTGSKVLGQEKLSCVACGGKGWVAVGPERQGGNLTVPNGSSPTAPAPTGSSEDMFAAPADEDPEAAALRAKGYIVMPPIGVGT